MAWTKEDQAQFEMLARKKQAHEDAHLRPLREFLGSLPSGLYSHAEGWGADEWASVFMQRADQIQAVILPFTTGYNLPSAALSAAARGDGAASTPREG